MKRPTLKRKVSTYTVVTWELAWDEDPAPSTDVPPSGDGEAEGGAQSNTETGLTAKSADAAEPPPNQG
jgi:hypothetical protein